MAQKKTVAVSKSEEPAPVNTKVVEAAPPSTPIKLNEDVPTVVVETPIEEQDKFAKVIDTLQAFQNQIKDILVNVKALQKEYVKLQKQKGRKITRKQSSVSDDSGEVKKRQPSGFAKPTKLSKELCEFLGVPLDTLMPRTEVTRILNEYIKTNKLQDPQDRRKIVPDDKLKKILTLTEGVPLSYFSLQSSIKNHFLKA